VPGRGFEKSALYFSGDMTFVLQLVVGISGRVQTPVK
jgi:hypothetical protein